MPKNSSVLSTGGKCIGDEFSTSTVEVGALSLEMLPLFEICQMEAVGCKCTCRILVCSPKMLTSLRSNGCWSSAVERLIRGISDQ